jgi:hypothetical protein
MRRVVELEAFCGRTTLRIDVTSLNCSPDSPTTTRRRLDAHYSGSPDLVPPAMICADAVECGEDASADSRLLSSLGSAPGSVDQTDVSLREGT